MNERILELFEQAHKEFSQEHQFATVVLPNPLKEKFAELIVKECCDAADMYVGVTGAVGDCISEYMGFGTEEGITEWLKGKKVLRKRKGILRMEQLISRLRLITR